MSSSEKRGRKKSRRSKKEQEVIDSIKQEEIKEKKEKVSEGISRGPDEIKELMANPIIQEKMLDMDLRLKYGFIRAIHNNFISINKRMAWEPEELYSIGLIFRDFDGIEKNVLETVLKSMETEDEENEEGNDEGNGEEVEEVEDIN